jgi:hypothetical protein
MAIVQQVTVFSRLWRKRYQQTIAHEAAAARRGLPRAECEIPVRLRLGPDLFAGRGRNLSPGGIGLRLEAGTGNPTLVEALSTHQRGAIELDCDGTRMVARVRIAHIQWFEATAIVGLAIDDQHEAERLIEVLDERA